MTKLIYGVIFTLLLTSCSQKDNQKALGTIEREQIILSATTNEIIRKLPISEGQVVKKGQVLVQLDTQYQKTLLAKAIANQKKAEASLLKLINGERTEDIDVARFHIHKAKTKFIEANKNYHRQKKLMRDKLISQENADKALTLKDVAQTELDLAKKELQKLIAGVRSEDITKAKAELSETKAEVDIQKQRLNQLTITATRDGVLDSLPYHLGERPPVNGVVAIIQADSVPFARVYIPETYRLNFIPGKIVSINIDGIKTPLKGTVRWVANKPAFTPYYALTEDERSRLMYLAKIDLNNKTIQVPSGITVQVDLSGK